MFKLREREWYKKMNREQQMMFWWLAGGATGTLIFPGIPILAEVLFGINVMQMLN